jgi:hypothetical protein
MILLVFALLLVQDKAVVEGTVMNAVTKEPLRKVGVSLTAGKKSYAVVSSSDGKFRFDGMEPGEYDLRAQRQGFFDSDEPLLEVALGQQMKDLLIRLTPQGIIAGHVLDEDGDPIPNATVRVERSIQVNGRRVSFGSDSESTNGEGYFFITDLRAGSYHLSAAPEHNNQNSAMREDFVSAENPQPLSLAPGAAIRDAEIRLRKSKGHRVLGRVSNLPKEHSSLLLASDLESYNASIRDGAFSFERVVPGNYILSMSMSFITRPDGSLARPNVYCHVPVTVSDHDVEGLVIELTPGVNIEGILRIDGEGHLAKPPSVGLVGNFGMQFVPVKEDGTFGWTNLSPTKHFLADFLTPEGFYTKSIQFNHQPVTTMIDLSSGAGGTLEIVIAPHPATVSATVREGKSAKVALWNDMSFFFQEPDASGVVQFKGLAPGEYRIAAWQQVEWDYLKIPDFRARFDAQKITLAEGSHENVDVKLIPKSASDGEAAKLQ